jgi:DNA processing protein
MPHSDSSKTDRARRQFDAALKWSQVAHHHLLTQDHPDYPSLLHQGPSAPPLIYAQGALGLLKKEAIAIVGARNATHGGQDNARAFARFLSEQGWCVVSGLAHGVDAAAHAGALQACTSMHSGGTIAVLGTGIDVMYPMVNQTLAEQILSGNGLLLSEFPLGTPAKPKNFPRRNRIVAGLARGVLVIEAALRSGSLITARLATDMGREVFALPGSIHSPLSRGPHALIKQGAKLVESGADILSELSHFISEGKEVCPTPAHATTSKKSKSPHSPVWSAIGYDPVSEDTLLERTGFLPALLQTELLTLELAGHIERLPSGRFVRK